MEKTVIYTRENHCYLIDKDPTKQSSIKLFNDCLKYAIDNKASITFSVGAFCEHEKELMFDTIVKCTMSGVKVNVVS